MPVTSERMKRLLITGLVGLLCLLIGGQAAAYIVLPAGATNQNLWMVLCNNGQVTGPYAGLGSAIAQGGALCTFGGGGGIIMTDLSVETALGQSCALPSNYTIGLDDGSGLRALTLAELQAILDATGGEPKVLVGVELMSVVVRGTELLSNPQALSPLPMHAIYSDEDDDGDPVGGPCNCVAEVPLSGTTSVLIALALVGVGLWTIKRRPYRFN